MLVVEVGGADVARRMECTEVWRKLLKLRQRCEQRQRFALQATRWKRGLPSVFSQGSSVSRSCLMSRARAQESFSGREEQLIFQERVFATM